MSMFQSTLLTLLKPNPRNARTHSKKQIRQIPNSIKQFGWTSPVVADEDYVILAGHGRYLAAKELGLEAIPTIIAPGLSDPQNRALMLADNKIAANAGWDRKALAVELGELTQLLPEINLNLDITGFETAEIAQIKVDLSDPETDPADEIMVAANGPVSICGDLWQLGQHRLISAVTPLRTRTGTG